MKKFFLNFLICTCFVMIASIIYAVATNPERPRSPQDQQFVAFARAYVTAFDSYRLNRFERSVKGELVDWEGMVTSVSPDGEHFDMVPNVGPTFSNGRVRLEAFVCLAKGEVPSNFHQGTKVRVRGKINSLSVLGVIVTGTVSEIR